MIDDLIEIYEDFYVLYAEIFNLPIFTVKKNSYCCDIL